MSRFVCGTLVGIVLATLTAARAFNYYMIHLTEPVEF